MLNIGLTEALKYGLGTLVFVAVCFVIIWAYRAAKRDGRVETKQEEDIERAELLKRLTASLARSNSYGTDKYGVRKPNKWPDEL